MDPVADMVRAQIRQRYARVAATLLDTRSGALIAEPGLLETGPAFGSVLYSDSELSTLPTAAVAASLGCGSPTAQADIRVGDRVLDLGCGGGIDLLLAARMVGTRGLVVGVDITVGMLDIARLNARSSGFTNICVVTAAIERLPFCSNTFDVVMSNCTVNLSPEKVRALIEAQRVLRPAGALHVTDIVAENALTPAERMERAGETGCTVGTLSRSEYQELLAAAGFRNVVIEARHQVADRMAATRIAARKPG